MSNSVPQKTNSTVNNPPPLDGEIGPHADMSEKPPTFTHANSIALTSHSTFTGTDSLLSDDSSERSPFHHLRHKFVRGVNIAKEFLPYLSQAAPTHSFVNVINTQADEVQVAVSSSVGRTQSEKYHIENFELVRSVYRLQHEERRVKKSSSAWRKPVKTGKYALDFIKGLALRKKKQKLLVSNKLFVWGLVVTNMHSGVSRLLCGYVALCFVSAGSRWLHLSEAAS
jgi:hypothetical protein